MSMVADDNQLWSRHAGGLETKIADRASKLKLEVRGACADEMASKYLATFVLTWCVNLSLCRVRTRTVLLHSRV